MAPSELLWIWSGAPWIWASLRDDGSAATELHRFFRGQYRKEHGRAGRLLRAALFVAGAPIVLGMIAVLTARHGSRVRAEAGKGRVRQAREQVELWLRRGVLPLSYYLFELYRGAAYEDALAYVYRYETKRGVYPLLRARFASPETTYALQDKALFARRCREHGVPAVPALFVVDGGVLTRCDDGGVGLPRRDLFLKPLTGSGGKGAAVWIHRGDGRYENAERGVLGEAELSADLRALSRRQAYVGRAYVTNHRELAEISSGALSSVRVVTCLDEAGRPEVTDAVLRMARTPGIVVDNFHAGGIAARVDLDSGIVGRATDLGLHRDTQWFDTHPTTGARITGRRIPMWEDVLDVARRAHRAFGDQIVVGWDVAVLDDGPQLIEGNKGPDFDIVQRTARAPIGRSRAGALLAFHLRRALGEADGRVVALARPSPDASPEPEPAWPTPRAHA